MMLRPSEIDCVSGDAIDRTSGKILLRVTWKDSWFELSELQKYCPHVVQKWAADCIGDDRNMEHAGASQDTGKVCEYKYKVSAKVLISKKRSPGKETSLPQHNHKKRKMYRKEPIYADNKETGTRVHFFLPNSPTIVRTIPITKSPAKLIVPKPQPRRIRPKLETKQ